MLIVVEKQGESGFLEAVKKRFFEIGDRLKI